MHIHINHSPCRNRGTTAMVDKKGYAYYAELVYHSNYGNYWEKYHEHNILLWYWDDNQYDILKELAVTKIEILQLKYDPVSYENSTEIYEPGADPRNSSSIIVLRNPTNSSRQHESELSMSAAISKSWTHTRQFAMTSGSKITVK